MTSAARDLATERAGAAAAPQNGAIRFQPLHVRTDGAAVSAFQAATSQPIEDFVPLTFPFCWLTLPAVRADIMHMIGAADAALVHEAQSFEYEHRLARDADYVLALEATPSTEPARVTFRGVVTSPEGAVFVRLETVLRIVSLTSAPPQ